jgi:biopolymer transport protein ExbD
MKKKLIGISVVGVLALGVYLGELGTGLPGLGSGGVGLGGGAAKSPAVDGSKAKSESVPAVERNALVVRVEDDRFLIRGDSGFAAASLEDVIERVKGIRPNASGVRICIRRDESAMAGAWGRLVDQLKTNGVDEGEINLDNDQIP